MDKNLGSVVNGGTEQQLSIQLCKIGRLVISRPVITNSSTWPAFEADEQLILHTNREFLGYSGGE